MKFLLFYLMVGQILALTRTFGILSIPKDKRPESVSEIIIAYAAMAFIWLFICVAMVAKESSFIDEFNDDDYSD